MYGSTHVISEKPRTRVALVRLQGLGGDCVRYVIVTDIERSDNILN